jgi:hypothetical protein
MAGVAGRPIGEIRPLHGQHMGCSSQMCGEIAQMALGTRVGFHASCGIGC